MKSLKYKMLVKFCVAVIIAIGIIEAIVAWKLDEAIPKQAGIVANDLTSETKRVVAGHARILKSTFEDMKGSVRGLAREMSKHPAMASSIERQQLAHLKATLGELCERLGMDFVLVYDVEGKLQSAFPGIADQHWAEEYYKSLGIGTGRKAFAKDETGEEATGVASILRYGSDSMKALGLEAHDVPGRGGISVTSLGVVRDDFGDAIGVCLAGKLLNHYHKPLQQLYDATGSTCVLYLGSVPMAHGGLGMEGSDSFDESALQLDPEAQARAYGSDGPSDVILNLAGRRYISSCLTIEDPAGQKIGAACAGSPEQSVLETRQMVLSHGFVMKRNLRDWLLGVGTASTAVFILVSLFIARGITRPINRVIKGLSEGAEQVASACNCVSSASQRLAECASEQAQSIRETSSSLGCMASTTAVNAGNADQTNRLMREANQIIARASESMNHLSCSMEGISTASENTQKIVRTIDQIAFQTNLLALNAAVEAARAGDTGAGFAVVADEVRNLALRAAEAARNTSSLIEDTVKKVKEGAALVERTSGEFLEVAGMVNRSGELVEQIAAASREQARGVQQVNKAVSEMDEATQQNAAIAEESASASEEMNAQAEQMREFVEDLIGLVDGSARNRKETETGTGTIESVRHYPLIPLASSEGVNGRGRRNSGNGHRIAVMHREWAEHDRSSEVASRLTIAEP